MKMSQGEIDLAIEKLGMPKPDDVSVAVEQNAWIIIADPAGTWQVFGDDRYSISGGEQDISTYSNGFDKDVPLFSELFTKNLPEDIIKFAKKNKIIVDEPELYSMVSRFGRAALQEINPSFILALADKLKTKNQSETFKKALEQGGVKELNALLDNQTDF